MDSTSAFWVGLLVAVLGFIAKDLIGTEIQGVRFRRTLVSDLKLIVDGFIKHLPALREIRNKLEDDPPRASFIWDSQLDVIGDLSRSGYYLKPYELPQCLRFYDETSRIEEIRREYNVAVRGILSGSENLDGYLRIANACLLDLEKFYRLIIRRGSECQLELNDNHWFLGVDVAQCKEILT